MSCSSCTGSSVVAECRLNWKKNFQCSRANLCVPPLYYNAPTVRNSYLIDSSSPFDRQASDSATAFQAVLLYHTKAELDSGPMVCCGSPFNQAHQAPFRFENSCGYFVQLSHFM